MKNVLIYITPKKLFSGEPLTLVKIQIDNSLDLGWKREDIILATNFSFEYNGVKSVVVSDDNFVPHYPRGSKHEAILELFNRGFITKGELYWFHDLDAYQSEDITKSEVDLGNADMALTDYCWRKKWNTGSIFFTSSAEDIFEGLVKTQSLLKIGDEIALMVLTNGFTKEENDNVMRYIAPEVIEKTPEIRDIEGRIKKINTTYNFVPVFNIPYCYMSAIKPIKVVHFHPSFPSPSNSSFLNFFMYGDNEINTVLMSKRLIKIFHYHGVK